MQYHRPGCDSCYEEANLSQVDVLIITALKEEYEAARDAGLSGYADNPGIAAWEDRDSDTPPPYIIGNYVVATGSYMTVALARPTRMGATSTGSLASSLVERLKPRCLAMCGVCAGNPANVVLGDVIVAELAYTYDEGKRTEADFEGDHRQIPLSDVWLRSAQDLSPTDLPSYGETSEDEAKIWLLERLNAKEDPRAHPARARYFPRNTWSEYIRSLEKDGLVARRGAKLSLTQKGRLFVQQILYDDIHGPQQLPFKVVAGPIASGNVVVKDGRTWNQLRQWGVRTVVGLEMEAAMIASTAHRLGVANWVVAKGVMDYADPRKDDRYKRFAARASAEVLFKLLTLQVVTAKSPHALIRRYGNWTLISPQWAFITAMQVDPFNPSSIVYAGMSNGQGVYRSSDGGRYWENIKQGQEGKNIRSIAVSSFDASLYAATNTGLWASNDHGVTWREHPDFENKSLLSVALSPHDPNILLVGCQYPGGMSISEGTFAVAGSNLTSREGLRGNGLKISSDRGTSWKTLPNPENVNGLWIDPEDSRVFAVVSVEDGVFFSRDGLEKLRRLAAFPRGHGPLCFAMLHRPDRLLVGTLHGGLYWSDDDGISWQRGEGIPSVQVSDIRFLVATPPRIAVATPLGPFESEDGGRRWHQSGSGLDYRYSMTLAPLADGSVILGTSGGGAYRRAAGQFTWNRSSWGFPPAVILHLEDAGGLLLAATVGLLSSRDGGASWRYLGLAGEQVYAIAVAHQQRIENVSSQATRSGLFVSRAALGSSKPITLKDDPAIEILIGTHEGQIFHSLDSGATWEALTLPNGIRHQRIRSTILSRGTARRIGALIEHEGFFVSDDLGHSWSAEASNTLGKLINLIVTSRHDDRKLFALTLDRGVFLSGDAGTTWTQCEGFPSSEIFTAIAETEDGAAIVFSASVSGNVYKSADGGQTFSRIGGVDLPPYSDQHRPGWVALAVHSRTKATATIVLGCSVGAYLSSDEGGTWEPLTVGSLENNYRVNCLLFTENGTRILMSTDQGLVYRELTNLKLQCRGDGSS